MRCSLNVFRTMKPNVDFFASLFFLLMPTDGEERAAAAVDAASEDPVPSSAEAAPAQINRPSNKRRRNLRQIRVTADDGEDDADAHGEQGTGNKGASAGPSIDHATLLEDTRALQKQRAKRTVGVFARRTRGKETKLRGTGEF